MAPKLLLERGFDQLMDVDRPESTCGRSWSQSFPDFDQFGRCLPALGAQVGQNERPRNLRSTSVSAPCFWGQLLGVEASSRASTSFRPTSTAAPKPMFPADHTHTSKGQPTLGTAAWELQATPVQVNASPLLLGALIRMPVGGTERCSERWVSTRGPQVGAPRPPPRHGSDTIGCPPALPPAANALPMRPRRSAHTQHLI